jgi:signal transduction histidine kinase
MDERLLLALIAFLAAVIIGLVVRLLAIRRTARQILGVLEDIEMGNANRRVFVHGKGALSEIGYRINAMAEAHQYQIADLEKSEQAHKRLLTSLSHDVRTPLTSLLGYLDALHAKVVAGDEQERYVEIARNKAYDLKNLVDILFEWFKLDSRERTFHYEKTDINEYTRSLIIDWIPVFEQKGIELEVAIADDECAVALDRDAYARIMNNLIQNAVIHSGGDRLQIEIAPGEDAVFVSVSDNGSGVPEAKLPYLFDRLYKCDDARSERGSGLGLSIVKELVTAHKGTVSVTSIPGERTTFTVSLPL